MILPIRAFGDPVLRKIGKDIDKDYPELQELIDNMFETMYSANGIGLAAPQIGLDIRLFVIDVTTGKLLFNTFVSHGRNSGQEMATDFSNDLNSFKSSLGFYVTGNNLAIITNYSGYDPEVSVRANGLTPGLDYSAYPKSRTFLFGLNATF